LIKKSLWEIFGGKWGGRWSDGVVAAGHSMKVIWSTYLNRRISTSYIFTTVDLLKWCFIYKERGKTLSSYEFVTVEIAVCI